MQNIRYIFDTIVYSSYILSLFSFFAHDIYTPDHQRHQKQIHDDQLRRYSLSVVSNQEFIVIENLKERIKNNNSKMIS